MQYFLFSLHVYAFILYTLLSLMICLFRRRNWKMIILIIFNFRHTRSFVKIIEKLLLPLAFFKQILVIMLKIILMSEVGQRLILTKYFLQTIAHVKQVVRWIQDVMDMPLTSVMLCVLSVLVILKIIVSRVLHVDLFSKITSTSTVLCEPVSTMSIDTTSESVSFMSKQNTINQTTQSKRQ